VSEILYTLVPLMRDVGLEAEWHVIFGREEFFNATKLMHNALQGSPQDLTDEEWGVWRRTTR
jgi:trehalose synthase